MGVEQAKMGDSLAVGFAAKSVTDESVDVPYMLYQVTCRDVNGNVRWEENVKNLVVEEGKKDLVNQYFKGSNYTAGMYLGLKDSTAVNVTNTLSSKTWSEVGPSTLYGSARPQLSFGTTGLNASNQATNQASSVTYTFSNSASSTVGGAFVCTVSSGTSGTLYSASNFSTPRNVVSNDTLQVTLTVIAA